MSEAKVDWKTSDVIRLIDFVIKRSGYVSNSKAKQKNLISTADYIKRMLISEDSHEARNFLFEFSQLKKSEVQSQLKELQPVFDWIASLPADHPDLFLRKLKSVTQKEMIGKADLNVITSIFSAYSRSSTPTSHGESKHIGGVGEKLTLQLKLIYQKEMPPNNWGGTSTLFKFIDKDGNIFTWFSGSATLKTGDTYHIVGSVKEHVVFSGVKQTTLTRCKVTES